MAKRKGMSESELASLLDGQIADAVSYEESELSAQRERALKYYEGTMDDLPSETGKSSVVSRDVADTLGWVMPGLMRVFLASDKVADYQPVGMEDIQFSKDATDGVNFLFLERCDGYRVLRSACHDGLLLGNGLIKHWWDNSPTYKTESFTGLSDDRFTVLVSDDDVEVLEHTEYPDPSGTFAAAHPNPALVAGAGGIAAGAYGGNPAGEGPEVGSQTAMGAAGVQGGLGGDPRLAGQSGVPLGGIPQAPAGITPPSLLHDVKIKRTIRTGQLRVEALPPEEFLIERSATVLDETVRFCAHRSFPTRSELIKRGYDRETVEALPAHSPALDEAAKSARDKHSSWNTEAAVDKSVEQVEIFECYVLTDYDGDGVAERRLIVIGNRGGEDASRKILENEEWGDDLPFTDIVPDPVPHRWRGRSLFDEMEDIQRVKTVLMRQTLDNLYLANNPQRAALLNAIENPDELVTPTIGGVVWEKTQGAVRDMAIPFVAQHSFTALGYMDEVGNRRVGQVSFGLDPETLQNQTATATQAQQSAATSKVELYARNIAEMGLKRLFKCLLKLVVKHQDEPFWIRRQGKPAQLTPEAWNVDMDVSINVGLGAGSRDRDMMMLQQVSQKQEMAAQILGPDNPIAGLVELRSTWAKMVEVGGLRSPELFFKEVTEDSLKEWMASKSQQPDPKMLELQAKAEIEKTQAQADMAVQQQKTQAEIALAERKFELERELKILEAQIKMRDHSMSAAAQGLRMRQTAQGGEEMVSAEDVRSEQMNATFAQLSQALADLAAAQRAPKRLVRGPDGRASHVETVG